jgi:uncharacterized ion transporter superfamily protein YfcC
MKLKFSFPSAYTITIIIIIITAALTWFMPAGSYNYRIDGTQTIIQADKAADYTGDKKLLPIPHTYQVMPSQPQGVYAGLLHETFSKFSQSYTNSVYCII